MFNIIGKRGWFFLLSAIIIIAGVISLVTAGLKPGIDFASGSKMTIHFSQSVDQAALRSKFTELNHSEAVIQFTTGGDYIIRTKELAPAASGNQSEQKTIEDALKATFGDLEVKDYSSVSPTIASQTVRNAGYAVLAATIGMLIYILWAFRKLPKPFLFGICSIIALIHDVLIVVGIFSIIGFTSGVEVDSMFIAAILTVVGYSINDTVVVYDRIRENVAKGIGSSLSETINISFNETLSRCLNTSITTLLALF
ncbi:MAG: protein translocase subunit SecF, partial [Chloroflexi bacterium]|nr:protein translocase subunit SecF [Chloroflexota bacterium]